MITAQVNYIDDDNDHQESESELDGGSDGMIEYEGFLGKSF